MKSVRDWAEQARESGYDAELEQSANRVTGPPMPSRDAKTSASSCARLFYAGERAWSDRR
jgi:hypothetical protein